MPASKFIPPTIIPTPGISAEVEVKVEVSERVVNWETFTDLPGAADINFEMLCRALVRRHYGRFGDFYALANQPGVEFHLKLHATCPLGEPGRWYGWQCRWYDLPSGRAIGSTRRRKIEEAITTTEAELPGLTDWVLWTRHPLTKGDQEWFYGLPTHMRLHLWTAAEVEEHLSGPAEILRGTHFGELVLTLELLAERHASSVARVKRRWQPEVHQEVAAERFLRRTLGTLEAWSDLNDLAARLEEGTATVAAVLSLPAPLSNEVDGLVAGARSAAASLTNAYAALKRGDYEILRQQLTSGAATNPEWHVLVRRLRAGRHAIALASINVLADIHGAHERLTALNKALAGRLVAVVADAGCGKTELAAQLTAPTGDRPSGVLLHGADLHAGHTLDDLARVVVVNGKPVPSFEALVAAVDAAGQRAGRRLPIVIDGLNEAEDPRDWKGQLASLAVTLQSYSYVLVVCTLRSAFAAETLPDDLKRLEIPDFGGDAIAAVRRYFRHYRIDPADAELPLGLLRHPLTLRMFCEVTNPERKRTVGVEAMPSSLTALFDRYLAQVAERIQELAPRTRRYYESDIRSAINVIGLSLWEAKARSLDLAGLRRRLGDDRRPWDESIVRALEHDGVLLRVPGDRPSAGHVAVVYDALAGHIVADALLGEFGGRGFETWLRESETKAGLTGEMSERHPLATDIFAALVGLSPRRLHRRQFWPLLDEPSRTDALYEAARLEGAYLDGETVSQLASLVVQPPGGPRDLLDRLWVTRAARSHPLDAEFLDATLRPMQMADRDLRWSEWLRRKHESLVEDLQRLEHRWRAAETLGPSDRLRAKWVMWTLTSTVRLLRDHATRALYRFGCCDPDTLFDFTIDALAVNDPYVPERMLAACYGVAMSLWADPRGAKVRSALPAFANTLADRMFVPGAPYPTRHALMRDYALGVVSVASMASPGCVPDDKALYFKPPFEHLPSPFPPENEISDSDVEGAKGAIRMDFGNYTMGRLIPHRRNYNFNDPSYREVRRQIEHRIVVLGYSPSRFAAADKLIGEESWRAERRDIPKTDRYGKKYSWIAFFEMYGLRLDHGNLSEHRANQRASDADIDPSFPEPAKVWTPPLPDPFATAPAEPLAWLTSGPTPHYDDLLNLEEVDGQPGPWVLLNGYVEQSAGDDMRQVFTFLRGLLVKDERVANVLGFFDKITYPGNDAIPAPQEDYYTFAGEIPWSPRFGGPLRNPKGRAKRDGRRAFVLHDGKRWTAGIPIEVPVYGYAWESHHSALNQVGGITIPAPALCERLRLSNRQGEWDFYDRAGRVATIYREFKADGDAFGSNLLYLRADLMTDYLAATGQTLVWLLWGERGIEHRVLEAQTSEVSEALSEYSHIHRRSSTWVPK